MPPVGTRERIRYSYWLHYAEGSLMPPLLLKLVFTRVPQAPMPALVRPVVRRIADGVREQFVEPQIKLHLDYLEGELGKTAWFAGEEFTAADIQMSFPSRAPRRGAVWTRADRSSSRSSSASTRAPRTSEPWNAAAPSC